MTELPLFPLGTVLFPGGRLPLQVFEPRYLDLVSESLKQEQPFGVVLIRDGFEVVQPGAEPMPKLAPLGTFATVVDWSALPGGRLGVTIEGGGKFRLLASRQRNDFLVIVEVEPLPAEEALPLPPQAESLLPLLAQLLEHPAVARLGLQPEVADGGRLANLLGQLLPVPEATKFELLAEPDPLLRLERLLQLLDRFGE